MYCDRFWAFRKCVVPSKCAKIQLWLIYLKALMNFRLREWWILILLYMFYIYISDGWLQDVACCPSIYFRFSFLFGKFVLNLISISCTSIGTKNWMRWTIPNCVYVSLFSSRCSWKLTPNSLFFRFFFHSSFSFCFFIYLCSLMRCKANE